jgi:hypothetical protein
MVSPKRTSSWVLGVENEGQNASEAKQKSAPEGGPEQYMVTRVPHRLEAGVIEVSQEPVTSDSREQQQSEGQLNQSLLLLGSCPDISGRFGAETNPPHLLDSLASSLALE